jgi:phage shock protein A
VKRLWLIIQAKFNKMLDRAEKPDELLDYSYEKQHGMLQEVRRGLTSVVASKKQLEIQADRLSKQEEKLDGQARQALELGREDLARAALERKAGVAVQHSELVVQIGELQTQQQKLEASQKAFAERLARFRSEKEVTKARYRAAEAMVKIGEATTGLGEDMASAGRALERADDKTQQMEARAAALDELIATGGLEDITGETQIDRELRQLAQTSQVDAELARMKAELAPAAKEPPAIEA